MFILPSLLLTLGVTPAPPPPPAAEPRGIVESLKVGGEGGWDYITLDAKAGRLYVPRSTHVMVLDLKGKVLGDIPGTAGVHGVALARDLDLGFASNGRANTMTVFKLSTLAVVKEVKTTGDNPDAILYEPATGTVFTFNGKGQNATVFDARTLEVKGTLPMGGKPEFSVCDGKGQVFVNVEDTSELLSINARTLKVEARWSLKPLEEPSGLAMDVAGKRLFSVGRNKLMAVVDATSGKLVTTLPIGAGCDGADFDPATGIAYASNGEGSLTLAKADAAGIYKVLATVPTQPGARTMVVDPGTHLVYLPTAQWGPAPAARPGERSRPPMVPGSFHILVVR